MAVRLPSRLGLDRFTWGELGPSCRVFADASLGFVVVAVTAGLTKDTWWSYLGAALASAAYIATPSSHDPFLAIVIGLYLAATQVSLEFHWFGILIGSALTDTSSFWVLGVTILVAMLSSPLDTALVITFTISAALVAMIGWVLYKRPTRKIARAAAPRKDDDIERVPLMTFENEPALIPDMIM